MFKAGSGQHKALDRRQPRADRVCAIRAGSRIGIAPDRRLDRTGSHGRSATVQVYHTCGTDVIHPWNKRETHNIGCNMAFQQQEDLGGVGQDRQFSIITTANIGGAVIAGLIIWQLTGVLGITGSWFSARWWIQMILIVLAAVLGVILTTRWSGLSLLDRIQLRIDFQLRLLAGDHILAPEASMSSPNYSGMFTLVRNGKVVARPYTPHSDDTTTPEYPHA